jgi:hypothetical protein
VLIAGQGTVGLGKGGLQVSEDLRLGSFRRQLRWRAPSRQGGTDFTLGQLEATPETLPGAITPLILSHGTCRRRDASREGLLQESPHRMGAQAQSPDFICQPHAESPPTSTLRMSIAAIDPPRPKTLSLALVIAHQTAMPNQSAHPLAMRTRRQLEPLHQLRPFLFATVKPALLDHRPPEIPRSTQENAGEGMARSRNLPLARGEVSDCNNFTELPASACCRSPITTRLHS